MSYTSPEQKKKGLLPGFIQCSFLTVHWVWEGCVRQPGQYTSGLQTKHRHVRPQEKLEFRHSKITFIWVIFRQWWIKSGSSEEGDVRAVSVTKLATWQLTLNWIMLTVTCHIKEPASVNQVSAKPDKKQLRRVETQQVRTVIKLFADASIETFSQMTLSKHATCSSTEQKQGLCLINQRSKHGRWYPIVSWPAQGSTLCV